MTHKNLYTDRKLAQGYPELQKLSVDWFSARIEKRPDDRPRIEKLFQYLGRLVNLDSANNILVLGCGPRPQPLKILLEMGYNAHGVEPDTLFVQAAQEYLGSTESRHSRGYT